jgi:hypothetical protein
LVIFVTSAMKIRIPNGKEDTRSEKKRTYISTLAGLGALYHFAQIQNALYRFARNDVNNT